MTALRPTGWSGSPTPGSPGHLLHLIRSRDNWTRQQLLAETGLSRTTLFERLGMLFKAGLTYESGVARSTGGRPAVLVRFENRGRVVLALDLGHRHGLVAVTDLDGTTLRERPLSIDIASPPATLLGEVCAVAEELLVEGSEERLVGVGLSIPGPVSSATGRLTPTTIMPGWDTFGIAEFLQERFGVPVQLENDARAQALGEAADRPEVSPLVAVKYSNGIGAGIVLDGRLLCGFDGAAGDIGHIRITDGRGRRCRCGRPGCLAAYASGHAILRELRRPASSTLDDLIADLPGDERAQSAVREAARLLGRTLVSLVATINPRTIVLGGALGRLPSVVDEVRAQIHAGAIERVERALIVESSVAHRPVAGGLAALVTGHVYAPATIDATLGAVSG